MQSNSCVYIIHINAGGKASSPPSLGRLQKKDQYITSTLTSPPLTHTKLPVKKYSATHTHTHCLALTCKGVVENMLACV